MSTITYNAELKFKDIAGQEYWTELLEVSRLAYNECADIITTRKVHLDLQSVHNAVYYELRDKFPTIPSQGIIKIYKDCISAFRSINSNGHVEHKVPAKKTLSMRLDKRLYSRLSLSSISLCSAKARKRVDADIVKYPKLEELFGKYPVRDPLIFKRGYRFFLALTFEVPEVPLKDERCIGVDLGERRFAITSDGLMLNDKEYNARRRKVRYLKRCLQKKGTKSAYRHRHKLCKKEQRQSDDMCCRVANAIIESTDASIIVLEDLSKIKQKNSKTKDDKKRKGHNRRISQVPFYKLKEILSYKALLAGKRRNNQAPREVRGFRLMDSVEYAYRDCFLSGRRMSGSFSVADITGKVLVGSVSYKKLTLKHHNNTYIMEETALLSSTKDG